MTTPPLNPEFQLLSSDLGMSNSDSEKDFQDSKTLYLDSDPKKLFLEFDKILNSETQSEKENVPRVTPFEESDDLYDLISTPLPPHLFEDNPCNFEENELDLQRYGLRVIDESSQKRKACEVTEKGPRKIQKIERPLLVFKSNLTEERIIPPVSKVKAVSLELLDVACAMFSMNEIGIPSEDKANMYRLVEILVDTMVKCGPQTYDCVISTIFWFVAWTSAFDVSRKTGVYMTYVKKQRTRGMPHIYTRKNGDERISWDFEEKQTLAKFCKNNFPDGRNFASRKVKNQRGGQARQFERAQRYRFMFADCIESILFEKSTVLSMCVRAYNEVDLEHCNSFEIFAHRMTASYLNQVSFVSGHPWLRDQKGKPREGSNLLKGVATYEDFLGPTTTVASFVMSYLAEIAQDNGVVVPECTKIADKAGICTHTYAPKEFLRLHNDAFDEKNPLWATKYSNGPPPPPPIESQIIEPEPLKLKETADELIKLDYTGSELFIETILKDARLSIARVFDCATSEIFLDQNKEEIEKRFVKTSPGVFSCKRCFRPIKTMVTQSKMGGTPDQIRNPFTQTFFSQFAVPHLKGRCKQLISA